MEQVQANNNAFLYKEWGTENISERFYKCDTIGERDAIPMSSLKQGDVVFVINEVTPFMLNGNEEWVNMITKEREMAVNV